MVNKNQNKILIAFIVCFFILSSNIFGVFASQIEEITFKTQSDHVLTLLDDLPIDINLLFNQDNFTMFEEMLDAIENYKDYWPIAPFGRFCLPSHIEGLDRSDFAPYGRQLEIRTPVDGIVFEHSTWDGTIVLINGIECVLECGLTVDIGNVCRIQFAYIEIAKTLWDEMETSGNVTLNKGDLLGFTNDIGDSSIVDFSYWYRDISIPPYYAFTPKLQGKVDVMYNFLYERAKLCGMYQQANLINEMFIHKDDEFWGSWLYKTGPFDSYIEEGVWIGSYDFGLYTFLNREFMTSETYWKNEYDENYNLTDDILGYGGNRVSVDPIPGHLAVELGHILLVEGDNTSGIIELRREYDSSASSYFGKFEVIVDPTDILSDELQLEFFPTLVEAQSGFTVNVSTFERTYHETIDDVVLPSPSTNVGFNFIYPTILGVIIVLIFTRKKKK